MCEALTQSADHSITRIDQYGSKLYGIKIPKQTA